MQTTSPIRRYVILRRRDHASDAARWSMEKVAPEQRAAAASSPIAQAAPAAPAVRA